MSSVWAAFVEALPGATLSDDADAVALALESFVDRSRFERPDLRVSEIALVRHVARGLEGSGIAAALERRQAGDLRLAVAVLAGDRAAAARFEAECMTPTRPLVERVHADDAFVEDVLQQLRTRLLVGEDAKLRLYAGLGPLAGWVRVAATRAAVRARQHVEREVAFDADLAAFIDSAGPGVSTTILGPRLADAVRTAFTANTPRDRVILRMYYADGRSLAEIGKVYRVHESTVSRWLARARESIRDAVYATLREELRLTRSEADGLLGLAVDVDVSMRSLLALGETDDLR